MIYRDNTGYGRVGRKTAALGAVSILALGLAMAGGAASAQTASPLLSTTADVAGGIQGVVVTASRISRAGFTAPTPVTSVGIDQLQQRAPTTLGDVLADIPSFRPSSTLSTSGVNSRGGGQITADLRGLGATRTLVLVDGRRFVPSTAEGTVDLKLIPSLLVNRVDVVTGGASAAWGSDAVAGVVNFILKDHIDGIQGTVQYGQSKYHDDMEYRASLAGGRTFFNDKLTFVAGADYLNTSGIKSQYTRPWGQREFGVVTNPNFATNGLPNFIIAPNFHTANMTQGGLVVSGPLRGTAFGPGGVPYQFQFGQTFGTTMIGGTREGENPLLAANLGAPVQSLTSMAKFNYEFSPKLSAFADFSLAWSKTGGNSQQPRDAGNLVIRNDNAFLPASVKAQMAATGQTTITIGRADDDTGYTSLKTEDQTYRGVAGLKGDLGGGWKWDAYYQYGRNRYALRFGPNNRIQANWPLAVDAVVAPNGSIVCRSSLTNPANGCVPINVFGNGSAKVNNFAFGTARFNLITQEQVGAINLNGEPIKLPGGPVSIAIGGEYRQEKAIANSDPLSQQLQPNGSVGAFALGNQGPLNGQYDVKEIYGETVVPLVHGVPGAEALDLNGAVRRTDYSVSGKVTTWKMGFTWQVVDDFRLRGTLSRDIRAPNLSELFQGGSGSSFTNVFDPVVGGSVQVRQVSQGNLKLQPEVAHTSTLGFAYQPSWFRRFSMSVDYYAINVKNVIGSVGAPTLAQGCFSGVQLYCQSIVFNPDRSIAFIISQQLNLNALKTQGYDIEAQYSLPMSTLASNWSGNLSLRVLATYVAKLVTIDTTGPHDRVGQLSQLNRVTGVPHWSGNADLTYQAKTWQVNLQARYIGSGLYSTDLHEGCCAANTIADNSVAPYVLFNLGAQIDLKPFGRNVQLFGLINNVLDRAPPFVPSGAAGGTNESSTNAAFYDVIGRMFKVGLRFKF
jgi:iron complex outermembrane receptor protein